MNFYLCKVTTATFFILFMFSASYAQTFDFTVTGNPLSKTVYFPGDVFTAGFDYCNSGTGTALSVSMGYYLSTDSILSADDRRLKSINVPSAPPGSCRYSKTGISIPEFFPAGEYLLIYKIDDKNLIAETNESNNLFMRKITIDVPMDVTLDNVMHAGSAYVGAVVWVAFDALNNSPVATPAHDVSYFLSSDSTYDSTDVFLLTQRVPTLAANDMVDIGARPVIPAHTPSGDYFLMIVMDSHHDLEELNETNNISYSSISIAVPPLDLIPVSAYISSDSIYIDKVLSLTFRIANIGFDFSYGCALAIYISHDSLFSDMEKNRTVFLDYFPAHSEVEQTIDFALGGVTGDYYLIIRIDPENTRTESNEENNIFYLPIKISQQQVDLVISNIELEQDTVIDGDSLNVSFTEQNVGHPEAVSHFTRFYLSTDTILDKYDWSLGQISVDTINAGESRTFTRKVKIDVLNPGRYYLIFEVDKYERVREVNEFNNVSFTKFMVTAPPQVTQRSEARSLSNVYPNPSSGIFNIGMDSDQLQDAVFEITSVIDGKTVAKGKLVSKQTSVDLGKAKGIYLLKIKGKDAVVTQRVIID